MSSKDPGNDASANGRIPASVMSALHTAGWEKLIPVLTDNQMDEFRAGRTVAEQAELDGWFSVRDIINPKPSPEVIAVSLFWKHANIGDPEIPEPTLDRLERAAEHGWVWRHHPYQHYVLPLLCGAARLAQASPEVTIRVYLASDLEFLIPALTEHCEVYLMQHSSLRHNPGAMWRLLAIEDAPDLVTVLDADLIESDIQQYLDRTVRLRSSGAGVWRRLYGPATDRRGRFVYRPLFLGYLGLRSRLPMRELMQSFLWHLQRGHFTTQVTLPDGAVAPLFGMQWPGYGIDESFLSIAAYPRLLARGLVTYAGAHTSAVMFPLDTSLAAAMSPMSEIIYEGGRTQPV